jgi:RNA polymerase sigma-70 factor (ECF subfamily)
LENADHINEPPDGAHRDEGDRDLLRRISCADRDAFRQLYLAYHKRLARFLVRVIRHPDDLEEVINDALLVVWQRAGDFRGASRVSTWILGIAYRCALKAIRRATARSRVAALELEEAGTVVEDATRETEERQLLDLGLSGLPLEQRFVLVLAYYLDYSCEEIAAIVECPVNTVKSRMLHARRKLRTIISGAAAPQGIAVESASACAGAGTAHRGRP